MAAKKAARGEKAAWIKNGLEANPDLGPTELAELLNTKAKQDGIDLQFRAVDISVAKSKRKGGAKPGRKVRQPRKATLSAAPAASSDPVVSLMQAARELGKDRARQIIDLMG